MFDTLFWLDWNIGDVRSTLRNDNQGNRMWFLESLHILTIQESGYGVVWETTSTDLGNHVKEDVRRLRSIPTQNL